MFISSHNLFISEFKSSLEVEKEKRAWGNIDLYDGQCWALEVNKHVLR